MSVVDGRSRGVPHTPADADGTGARLAIAARTARCRAPKTARSSRRRTSAFVGCTLTSTVSGGTVMSSTATGLRPTGSMPWYASSTAKVSERFFTQRRFT